MVLIRKISASELAKRRGDVLDKSDKLKNAYYEEFECQSGTQSFLNSISNYPLLVGSPANLYKCFLPQSWRGHLKMVSKDFCIQREYMMILKVDY